MAKYPIRITFPKPGAAKPAAPKPQNRPAPAITQKDLDRHARIQGIEAGESSLVRRPMPKASQTISTTVRMRETPTKKGR